MATNSQNKIASSSNFIRAKIEKDISNNLYKNKLWNKSPGNSNHQSKGELDKAKIRTRFPPEPNGYLHIGHAKSIFLNFGLAQDFSGACHLRFDDTNPEKEDQEYVDSIIENVKWLGFDWNFNNDTNLYYASNYFDFMYEAATLLIKSGFAYVDQQNADEIRENRGTSLLLAKIRLGEIIPLKNILNCLKRCVMVSIQMALWYSEQKSIWPRQILTFVIQLSIELKMSLTIKLVISGQFIRCIPLLTLSRMHLKA